MLALPRQRLAAPAGTAPVEARTVWFNGAPGAIVYESGVPASAFQFQVEHGRIIAIYVQRNPDKLRPFSHLAES